MTPQCSATKELINRPHDCTIFYICLILWDFFYSNAININEVIITTDIIIPLVMLITLLMEFEIKENISKN